MKANMGKCDRTARFIIGIAIIAAGFFYGSWWGLLGLIPLVTASINHCPLYSCCKKPDNTDEKQDETTPKE